MELSFFKKRDNSFLILDIGTEAVKALVVSFAKREKILERRILAFGLEYYKESDIFIKNGLDFEAIKQGIEGAVKNCLNNLALSVLERKTKDKILKKKKWEVFVSFSSVFLRAGIKEEIFLRDAANRKISKQEKEKIEKTVLEQAKKKIADDFFKKTGILAKDIYWLKGKILEKRINGYPVDDIDGLKGKELYFKILIGYSPLSYFLSLKKIIESLDIKIRKIIHLAEALSVLNFLNEKNAFFIDIGGFATQFLAVKGGKLEGINDFFRGGLFLTRALEEKFGFEESMARLIKEKHFFHSLSQSADERVKEIFSKEAKNWYNDFRKVLNDSGDIGLFNLDIFLFGGGSCSREIKEVFQTKKPDNFFNFSNDSISADFLNLKDLDFFFKADKEIKQKIDTPQWIPILLVLSSLQVF